MRASGKQAQHARGIFRVCRLFQQVVIHHNHGVGSEYHIVGVPRKDGAGFVAGQALRVVQGLFLWQGLLGDVGRFDGE